MHERDLIGAILARFPRHPAQRNGPFLCDAEVVPFGGALLAVTIDEFTAAEDGLRDDDPAALGWNLATATVSDLLAAGAAPRFFLHSFAAPPDPDGRFVAPFMDGAARALAACGAMLLGGDTGSAPAWRYTGCALGDCGAAPVLRRADEPELILYATGDFGDGNLAALSPRHIPRFESRAALAARVRPLVRLAIDSSDGLRESLLWLARLDPRRRIVASADAPLHPAARDAAKASGLPAEAFLIGSCGEYELLLGVRPEDAAAFESLAAGEAGAVAELSFAAGDAAGLHWAGGRLTAPRRDAVDLPDPRATPRDDYIAAVVRAAGDLFYTPARRA